MKNESQVADTGVFTPPPSISPLKPRGLRRFIKNNGYGYLFLSPWLLGFLIFTFYPLIHSFYLSFTNYAMKADTKFVGFQNYILLFRDDTLFKKSIQVTVQYVLISVPLQLAFALFLAMLLNNNVPGLKYFRAAYYLPALMGGSVAVAILWRQLFGMEGIVNSFLAFLGAPESITMTSWIASPDFSLYTLILLRVWQFGSPMIIFLAGLKQVPAELYETASLDGAGAFKRFTKITFPMISPIVLFNLVMQLISAFQTFTSAFIIGGNNSAGGGGGIANSLLFYTIYLYRMGFQNFKMGIASAMAWVLVLITGVLTVVIFKTSDAWVNYND